MSRNRRTCIILALAVYVSLVSYYRVNEFFSSLRSNNNNIGIVLSRNNTPFLASSFSSSVDSLIGQLRDKLLEETNNYNDKRVFPNSNVTRSNNSNGSNSSSSSLSSTQKTILCCIALHEEAYIDEFVDYHLGIGFRKIIVYDNSDHYELKQWGDERNRRRRFRTSGRTSDFSSINNTNQVDSDNEVHVVHFPGRGVQSASYLDCAQRTYRGEFGDGIKNAAFWDVDEFLILKQHITVDELLEEYMINKGASSLSINWYIFRQGYRHVYEPLPVTKRFLYREREVQYQVKSMVRLRDMDMTVENHPHFPYLKNGTIRIDTNGTRPYKMFNHDGPSNIAILHHYQTKSYAEYIKKRERGRAEAIQWNPVDRHPGYEKRVKEAMDEYIEALQRYNNSLHNGDDRDGDDDNTSSNGTVYDDTAWMMMKRVCPKYALYDLLDEI